MSEASHPLSIPHPVVGCIDIFKEKLSVRNGGSDVARRASSVYSRGVERSDTDGYIVIIPCRGNSAQL